MIIMVVVLVVVVVVVVVGVRGRGDAIPRDYELANWSIPPSTIG